MVTITQIDVASGKASSPLSHSGKANSTDLMRQLPVRIVPGLQMPCSPSLLCSGPLSNTQSRPIASHPSDPKEPAPSSWLRHKGSAAVLSREDHSPRWHQPNPAGKLMGIRRFACTSSNGRPITALWSGTEILRLALRSGERPGLMQR